MERFLRMSRQGFSLVEMIIVVGVLAILVSISSPALFEFMKQRDIQEEENTHQKILQAFKAYVAEKGVLPEENNWATALGGYTNMSVQQIGTDVWGNSRTYVAYIDGTRNLQGETVSVTYITLLSMGPNGQAENGTGIAKETKNGRVVFADPTDKSWWDEGNKDSSGLDAGKNNGIIIKFSEMTPAGDDLASRYTNYPEKIQAYNLSAERMNRVVAALEAYSQNGYANRVAACSDISEGAYTGKYWRKEEDGNLYRDSAKTVYATECNDGMPEKLIYYPRSSPVSGAPLDNDDRAYDASYDADTTNDDIIVDNSDVDNHAARLVGMQNLMSKLGLPKEFCCSALSTFVGDGGKSYPMPFYYFSNPRDRTSGSTCKGTRRLWNEIKLPARLTTTGSDSGNPPACG